AVPEFGGEKKSDCRFHLLPKGAGTFLAPLKESPQRPVGGDTSKEVLQAKAKLAPDAILKQPQSQRPRLGLKKGGRGEDAQSTLVSQGGSLFQVSSRHLEVTSQVVQFCPVRVTATDVDAGCQDFVESAERANVPKVFAE